MSGIRSKHLLQIHLERISFGRPFCNCFTGRWIIVRWNWTCYELRAILFSSEPEDKTFEPGENITLVCGNGSLSSSTFLKWTKDENILFNTTSHNISLVLSNLTKEDAGLYICTANNSKVLKKIQLVSPSDGEYKLCYCGTLLRGYDCIQIYSLGLFKDLLLLYPLCGCSFYIGAHHIDDRYFSLTCWLASSEVKSKHYSSLNSQRDRI